MTVSPGFSTRSNHWSQAEPDHQARVVPDRRLRERLTTPLPAWVCNPSTVKIRAVARIVMWPIAVVYAGAGSVLGLYAVLAAILNGPRHRV